MKRCSGHALHFREELASKMERGPFRAAACDWSAQLLASYCKHKVRQLTYPPFFTDYSAQAAALPAVVAPALATALPLATDLTPHHADGVLSHNGLEFLTPWHLHGGSVADDGGIPAATDVLFYSRSAQYEIKNLQKEPGT